MKFWTVILCLGLATASYGFIQKLTLEYDSGETTEGDSFVCNSVFRSKVADAEALHIGNITRICFHGFWTFYNELNFNSKPYYNFYMNETCYERNSFPYKSFRFGGVKDTSIDSISIYNSTFWVGEEHTVTLAAHAGIPSGKSVVITGKSKWTLFTGNNFEGQSKCAGRYTSPDWEMDYWSDVGINFSLNNVGSVIKGCDEQTIADIQARARRGEKFN